MNAGQTASKKKNKDGNAPRKTYASRLHENAAAISREAIERLKDRKRFRRYLNTVLVALILAVILGVFGYLCLTFFFRIETVVVTGGSMYAPDALIARSGIETGGSMFTVNASAADAAITMKYPYIKEVRVRRHLPSTIELEMTEDTPYYYLYLGGEYFVLSGELRVLERRRNDVELKKNGLKKIVVPDVTVAVVGRTLSFAGDKVSESTQALLDSIRLSPIYEWTDMINVRDRYNIYIIYNNKFKVVFGKYTDMELKLLLVDGIIREMGDFNGLIDVSNIRTSFAIMDNSLVLE